MRSARTVLMTLLITATLLALSVLPNHAQGATTQDVTIANFAFVPASLTVRVGDTVRWTNTDGTTHTSTSTSGGWDSGNLATNASFSFTLTRAGTFAYLCSIHSTMRGTIVVEAAPTGLSVYLPLLSKPQPTSTVTPTSASAPQPTGTTQATTTTTPATTSQPTVTPAASPTPSLPESSFDGCQTNPTSAVNYPVQITNIDKESEVVYLTNVSSETIHLTGWHMCSLTGNQEHAGMGGLLAPGQTQGFAYSGSGSIWNNSEDDDGALYNQSGQLVSYYND